jgi:hypothetical protein
MHHRTHFPQKLGDRLHELHLGGHTKYGRSLGKDVLHDPRGDRLLGVGDQGQQASGFLRAALGLLHVIALEVPEQIEGLDPILAKRLVGNAEKPRHRAADIRRLELEVLEEEMLEGHPCSRAALVAASSSAPVSLPSLTRPSYLRLGLHQSMAPLGKGHRQRLPSP